MKFRLVNANLENSDFKKLETLMEEDGFTTNSRSAFIRRLIRQEYARRNPEKREEKNETVSKN